MSVVISVALPVFAIIAAGFAAARVSALSADDAQALNRFVFRLAMPVALFGLAARTEPPGAADLGIVCAYAIAASTAMFGGYFTSKALFRLTNAEAGAHGFSSGLGNAVFLGLPIAMNIDGWARPFIVLMLIESTVFVAIGAALMAPTEKGADVLSNLAGALRNPLVIGMAAGFIYSALGLPLTGPFETLIEYLTHAAGPTALISLGVFLATHHFPAISQVAGRVALIAAAKIALLPAVALSLASVLGVSDPNYIGALALFTFVPTAIVSFIMASQYGVYKTEAAAAVLTTTLLSLLAISGVLWVFA